jgi:hypothetical protein
MITDDLLNSIFCTISARVRVTCVFDSCHSGSVIDLPFSYDEKMHIFKRTERSHQTPLALIVSFSGCRDEQTSAEKYINGKFQGALTATFVSLFHNHSELEQKHSYAEFVHAINSKLSGQRCILSCSRIILSSQYLDA